MLDFARITAPLIRNLLGDLSKEFVTVTVEEPATMKELNDRSTFSPVLAFPSTNGHIALDMDVRNVHVGCVLL